MFEVQITTVRDGVPVRLSTVARVLEHRRWPLSVPLTSEEEAARQIAMDALRPYRVIKAQADDPRMVRRTEAENKALATPRPTGGWGSTEAPDSGRLYLKTSATYGALDDYLGPATGVSAFKYQVAVNERGEAVWDESTDLPSLRPRRRVRQAMGLPVPNEDRLLANAVWRRFCESLNYLDALTESELLTELHASVRARNKRPKAASAPHPPSALGFLRAALADGAEHHAIDVTTAAIVDGWTKKQIRSAREQLERDGEMRRARRGVWVRAAGS